MKYIRTKDGIFECVDYDNECIIPSPIIKCEGKLTHCPECDITKQADTIEELCDEFVLVITPDNGEKYGLLCMSYNEMKNLKKYPENGYYGAIWTEWGLKYIAKMNKEGELELL